MLKVSIQAVLCLILLVQTAVPVFTLPIMLSMLCGFSISIGTDWSNNDITFKKSIIKGIYALSLSYLGLFVWQDFEIKWNIVYYTATVSCFSMFIVGELKIIFEGGFKTWARKWINNIIAKDNDRS